jgi:hypothetical protein
MILPELLRQKYAHMESLGVPKFPCGRYKIGFGRGLYWLDKDGSLELILKSAEPKKRPEWMS